MLQRLILNDTCSSHRVVALTSVGIIGEMLKSKNIDIISMGMNSYNFILVFFRLIFYLRNTKPDIVQTWMYHSDLLGGLASRIAGIKKVFWNIRNTEIPQKLYSRTGLIIRLCSLFSYFIPEKIICCAVAAKKHHIHLHYCERKMIVIPNGFNVPMITYNKLSAPVCRKDLAIGEDSIVIGIVGRYDFLKGYDIFIEATSLLALNTEKDLTFLCIGRDVDYSNSLLVTHINKFDLLNSYKLIGEVISIDSYYPLIDIFCLSSRSEGFPNVVAEAMIASLPCVVTDVGDAALIVADDGIVVPPNDHVALSNGLRHFVNMDESTRNYIGERGRKRVLKNYNINNIVQKYREAYCNCGCLA